LVRMESDWVYCHFRQKKDSLNNFMDKLVDELAKGRKMEKILRQPKETVK